MKYVVEIGGRRLVVDLAAGGASVDGGEVHAVKLADVEGTPVRIVTIDQETHRVTATRDGRRGHYILRIDGRRYDVDALDERTRAIRDLADAARVTLGPASLVAPMPGLIVRVHVKAGDAVSAGQGLVAMEAMKMENELRAPAAGTVKLVHAVPGQAVEKGALLVEFDAP